MRPVNPEERARAIEGAARHVAEQRAEAERIRSEIASVKELLGVARLRQELLQAPWHALRTRLGRRS